MALSVIVFLAALVLVFFSMLIWVGKLMDERDEYSRQVNKLNAELSTYRRMASLTSLTIQANDIEDGGP